MIKKQGSVACEIGQAEENRLKTYLDGMGFIEVTKSKHLKYGFDIPVAFKMYSHNATYMRHVRAVLNMYKLPWTLDFLVWSKTVWPRGLVIEVKTQSVGGSVDEKLPFVVESLLALDCPSAMLLAGNGFRNEAIMWAEDAAEQTANRKLTVWRDAAALRTYIETGQVSARRIKRAVVESRQKDLLR